jgi:hypothetical protein
LYPAIEFSHKEKKKKRNMGRGGGNKEDRGREGKRDGKGKKRRE